MVIKVDFDLAVTVLAFNLYRLCARDLPPRFRRHTATTLFAKGADIVSEAGRRTVKLQKKRSLHGLLEAPAHMDLAPVPWLGHRWLEFAGAIRT